MRRYGRCAGNPRGVPEDPTRCYAEVYVAGIWMPRQCMRKRGYGFEGIYCQQHAGKGRPLHYEDRHERHILDGHGEGDH